MRVLFSAIALSFFPIASFAIDVGLLTETYWSVGSYEGGYKDTPHPTPWQFHSNKTVNAGNLWRGTWREKNDNTIYVFIPNEYSAVDAFEVTFTDSKKFIALKNNKTYRWAEIVSRSNNGEQRTQTNNDAATIAVIGGVALAAGALYYGGKAVMGALASAGEGASNSNASEGAAKPEPSTSSNSSGVRWIGNYRELNARPGRFGYDIKCNSGKTATIYMDKGGWYYRMTMSFVDDDFAPESMSVNEAANKWCG